MRQAENRKGRIIGYKSTQKWQSANELPILGTDNLREKCPRNQKFLQRLGNGPYVKAKPKGCISHNKQKKIPIGQQDDFGDYT
ncbi:unnamed protein product [Cylicostephanus goldi]|uniref:Uncharacterized protein n=1 Tax=Cylicostephanus goldi TaxID=71465 RepID=A0A3P6TIK1_CYLGO|nr:unnamed protein product [Cylicostephanus goldi]